VAKLPVVLQPLSYMLPLTYGVDALRGAIPDAGGGNMLPLWLDIAILGLFCLGLFTASLWNVRRKWIA
jgi:ABC-2 type transport system permease protein